MSMGQAFVPCVVRDPKDETKFLKVDGYTADNKSGIIYYRKTYSDVPLKFSTKIKALSVNEYSAIFNPKARTVANRMIKEFFEKRNNTQHIKPLLMDIWPELIARRQKAFDTGNLSKGPKFHCENSGKKFLEFWGDKFPEDVTTENWEIFEVWYKEQHGKSGKENVTKYFRVFVKFLIEKGYLLKQPRISNSAAKETRIARKRAKSRLMTDSESDKLIEASEGRDRLITMMMSDMAFRISEPCELSWARVKLFEDHPELKKDKPDLDVVMPVIVFTEGDNKSGYDIEVPIPDRIYWELRALKETADSQWVFPQLRDHSKHIFPQMYDWNGIKERSGITWATPHSFRHYRLTKDFANPDFAQAQVCIIRRVSLKVALEHYIKPDRASMVKMRNSR